MAILVENLPSNTFQDDLENLFRKAEDVDYIVFHKKAPASEEILGNYVSIWLDEAKGSVLPQELENLFLDFGSVESIFYNKSDNSAIVWLTDDYEGYEGQREAIVSLNGKEWHGQILNLRYYDPEEELSTLPTPISPPIPSVPPPPPPPSSYLRRDIR